MQVAAPLVARPVRLPLDLRGLACALALLLGQAAMLLIFTNVPAGYRNPAWLTREAVDLFEQLWSYPRLTLDPGSFPALVGATLAVTWLAYILAARVRPSLTLVFAVPAAVGLLLVALMPPVLSSDLFLYGVFGRMVAFYGLNPYAGAPVQDPIAAFTQWSGRASLYGPVWTFVSTAVALAAGQSILWTAIGFKLIATASHLVNGALVYAIASRLGRDASTAALLYLWNPLILLESAGSGHNDAFMMMLVLGGVLLALQERRGAACALVSLAVLVKYLPLVLLFFLALYWARTSRRPVLELFRPGAVLVALCALCYLPFAGGGANFLAPIADYSSGHFRTPIRVALLQILAPSAVSTVLTLSFGALGLWLGWAVLRRPTWQRVVLAWASAAFYYLAVVYPWNFPWYMVSPLASSAPVHDTRRGRQLLMVATVAGVSWSWIQYGVLLQL